MNDLGSIKAPSWFLEMDIPSGSLLLLILLIILKSDKNAVFLGDGVLVYQEFIKDALGDRAFFANVNNNMQRAASVAVAASKLYENKEFDTYLSLVPKYLRKSQAEREYEEKQKNGGN